MNTTMSDTDVPQNGPIECPEGDNLPEGFVCIPAGEFWMGTPEDQIPRNALEEERHRVRITQPYLMGAYEVTQSEWNAVMETVPSYFSESGAGCTLEPCETRPVERVNWHEVIVYANQRSEAEGLTPCYATTGCSGELGIGCERIRRTVLPDIPAKQSNVSRPVMAIDSPQRRSGNMPLAPAMTPTDTGLSTILLGIWVQHAIALAQWVESSPMHGASTICMGMCPNGHLIHLIKIMDFSVPIRTKPSTIQSAESSAIREWSAVAIGRQGMRIAGRRAGKRLSLPTRTKR